MNIWFSGYTNTTSKGIYRAQLTGQAQLAKLSEPLNVAQVNGPTYLQIDHELVFAITKQDNQGGIVSFKMTKSGQLARVNTLLLPGASPCYLGINSRKKFLYTANYHTGRLSILSYQDTGQLQLLTTTQHQKLGLGPRLEQDAPHPHFFDQTPASHLVSCDLGTDRVDFYDYQDQKLRHLAAYQMSAGFGPRHLVFSLDGKIMYVIGELSSQIEVVRLDEINWRFDSLQTVKTVAAGNQKQNGAAAIYRSGDGKFLYASNRGNDSLVVFAIGDDGKLDLIQRISTFGSFPRDFNWDSSQAYVIVANQMSHNATLYYRNQTSGLLAVLQKNIPVPEATRVLFTD